MARKGTSDLLFIFLQHADVSRTPPAGGRGTHRASGDVSVLTRNVTGSMSNHRRRLRVILNGKSAGEADVEKAFDSLRAGGHRVEVEVTSENGDARRFARAAAQDGVDSVVAAGGDGTLNEVVDGLVHAGSLEEIPSVGVLPLGTANDFAETCGIPVGSPLAALELTTDVEPSLIDVGEVNDACFINVASGGFGSRVTAETPDDVKEALGRLSYLLTGVRRFNEFSAERGEVRGPDFAWQGSFYVLAVGNGRRAGGGINLCPDAYLDDGLLDVVVLPEIPPEERLKKLLDLLAEGLAVVEREMFYRRVSWLEVSAPAGLYFNLDGEPIEGTSFRFKVLPKRIRVHLPPGAPLVGATGRTE
jgi:lipid kinase YegS